MPGKTRVGGLLSAVALIALSACSTKPELLVNADREPILITEHVMAEGVPLAMAMKGGGPAIKVNLQGGAWMTRDDWSVVRKFAEFCRADKGCRDRAIEALYELDLKR